MSLERSGVTERGGIFYPERECGRREKILRGEQGGSDDALHLIKGCRADSELCPSIQRLCSGIREPFAQNRARALRAGSV